MATLDFLMEARLSFTGSTTVEGVLYGFAFALYVLCISALYPQLKDPDRRKQTLTNLIYMSLIMLCGFINIAVDAREAQVSYVDHGDYPGGGLFYIANVLGPQPISIVGYVTGPLLDTLTFGIQIWRLWVVWQTSRYCLFIVVIPTLCLLAYTALTVAPTVMVETWSNIPGLLAERLITAGEGLQLSITVFVTLFIITRIAMARRKHIRSMGQSETSSQFTSIISMLVESYALETLWITAAVVVASLSSSQAYLMASVFLLDGQPIIQIFSYLLVIYRVSTGRGWQKDTEERLTSLQWNHDELRSDQLSTRSAILVPCEEV